MEESEILYSRILKENIDEFSQWRFVINRFRGVEYFQIRKYFLTFEGTWQATKDGFNTPLDLLFTTNLMIGISEVLAEAELTDSIKEAAALYKEEVKNNLIELLTTSTEIYEQD